MQFTRNKVNLFVILAVGIGIQVYYKIKFYLTGQFAIDDLWHWLTFVELLFGFLLATLVVVGHEGIVSYLRKRLSFRAKPLQRLFIQVLVISVYAAIAAYLFTTFFWSVILKIPMTSEYIFDFVIISLFVPILVNGVSESLYYYG